MSFIKRNFDFPSLEKKMLEMGLSFRSDININHFQNLRGVMTPHQKAEYYLSMSFSDDVKNHIDYIKSQETSVYVMLTISDKNSFLKSSHVLRTPQNVQDIVLFVLSFYLHGKTENISIVDSNESISITHEDKEYLIEPLYNCEFVKVNNSKAKKVRNAFKGLHTASPTQEVIEKFGSIPLLAKCARKFNAFRGDQTHLSPSDIASSPYIKDVANYAHVFMGLMNDHLINEKISTSQSQQLFAAYCHESEWSQLSKNEKKFAVTPFRIFIENGDNNYESKIARDFVSAVTYAIEYIEGKEDVLVENIIRQDTFMCFSSMNNEVKITIQPLGSICKDYAKQQSNTGINLGSFRNFETLLRIKKSFLAMKPKQKETPVLFEKVIGGVKWSLIMERFRGVSTAIKDYGYHTAEIGNASIIKSSKKSGYALCRYDYEERFQVGHLSNADLQELSAVFGVGLGSGCDSAENFKESQAYYHFKIWAKDNLEEWMENHAVGFEGKNQANWLLSNP